MAVRAALLACPKTLAHATSVPEQAENYGQQRSPMGNPNGLRPGHAQVDPLRETYF